jgi:ferritin
MLTKSVQKALNEQINAEMYSAYAYLSMSTYCAEHNFNGFAQWLRMQSGEENEHAMKFYHYVHQHGGHVELESIAKPPVKFKSPMDVFGQVLAHEKNVTALITKLYELALKEKDYATQAFLQWFITEQVEEESAAVQIVERMTMVGSEGPQIFLLDRELGMRAGK